jgi:non-heme chloroperoxidase
MAEARTPVVFVHGLWLHADSWDPWVEHFRESGYSATAPGWPGDGDSVEETRKHPERVAGHGIDSVVAHYVTAIRSLEVKPIVVGHSFGGLIAQRLLAEDHAAAAVAIDAAPIKGVRALPLSALRVASIALRTPANRNRAVSLTPQQFRYGFANAVSAQESAELYARWTIPSPAKPLFEAAFANFAPHSPAAVRMDGANRGPLLLTAGGRDHTVPPPIARATLKLHRKSSGVTDFKEFPDRGHSLCIDGGWQEIADAVLGWLKERSL